MKLRLIIDGLPHEIDSTDPELLARWIIEIFGRLPEIYPSTLIEIQTFPSFVLLSDGQWGPDWLADSRVTSQMRQVRSPRNLVAELGKMIDEYEQLGR